MKVQGTNVSLLGKPSKMPGRAFGMPARRSCFRMNGSICQKCYAAKGAYGWSNVQAAFEARYQWAMKCMKTEDGRAEFVTVMTAAIGKLKSDYFRIHDSGDFLSAAYADCWYQIAKNLPNKKFWGPTRIWQRPAAQNTGNPFVVLGQSDPLLAAVVRLNSLPNVTIRPSALNENEPAPRVKGLAAGSTVSYSGAKHRCPAPSQGGACGDCRHCWDNPRQAVDYRLH